MRETKEGTCEAARRIRAVSASSTKKVDCPCKMRSDAPVEPCQGISQQTVKTNGEHNENDETEGTWMMSREPMCMKIDNKMHHNMDDRSLKKQVEDERRLSMWRMHLCDDSAGVTV